jgi:hypothetical protein
MALFRKIALVFGPVVLDKVANLYLIRCRTQQGLSRGSSAPLHYPVGRILNLPSVVAESLASVTSTFKTCAPAGPCQAQAIIFATASALPETMASTEPSSRFLTHPDSLRACASLLKAAR